MKTMETIKATTNKAKDFISRYLNSVDYMLSDVYTTVSAAKQDAYNECMRICEVHNGIDFKIISYNTFLFTVAWIENNSDLHIETASTSYIIKDAF